MHKPSLEKLYNLEKGTEIQWRDLGQAENNIDVEDLLNGFLGLGWLNKSEFVNTSALIIERIILRLHKLGHFPRDVDQRVFNRIPDSK